MKIISRVPNAKAGSLLFAAALIGFALSSTPAFAQEAETFAQAKIRLFSSGLKARDSGDLRKAKSEFEQLLRMDPNDARTQQMLDSINKAIETQSAQGSSAFGKAAGIDEFRPVNVEVPKVIKPYSGEVQPVAPAAPSSSYTAPAQDLPMAEVTTASQEKVRLLSEAVRAREKGDYATAKTKLEQIRAIDPNDPTIQPLIDSTSISMAEKLKLSENAGNLPTSAPVLPESSSGRYSSADLDTVISYETDAQKARIKGAEASVSDARKLIKAGRTAEAEEILARVQAQLPVTVATARVLEDARQLRGQIMIDKANKALSEGKIEEARSIHAAYVEKLGADPASDALDTSIETASKNPAQQDPAKLSPEFVKTSAEVDQLIVKARAQMLYGDYEGAQSTLRDIEAISPSNIEAKALQLRVSEELNRTSHLDYEKTRAEMLQEVSRQWQRPQIFNRRAVAETVNTGDEVVSKLRSIKIPEIDFNAAPLGRVIKTLSQYSVQFDPARTDDIPDSEQTLGVNMILFNQEGANTPVTINLRDQTLDKILDFVVETVGFTWDVQRGAVGIRKGGNNTSDLLETEFFPISRQTQIRIGGVPDDNSKSNVSGNDPFSSGGAASASASSAKNSVEDSLKSFFEKAGIPFESVSGATLAFDGAQIIVTQTRRNLEKIRTILRNYDQPKQVEVEAKFLEVVQGNLEQLGFNWSVQSKNFNYNLANNTSSTASLAGQGDGGGFVTENRSLGNAFGVGTGGSQNIIANLNGTQAVNEPFTPPVVPNSLDIAQDVGSQVGGLAIIDGTRVGLVVDALSRQTGSDLLTAPRVTVLSGRTAEIVVAQELLYPENYSDTEAEADDGSVAITPGTPQDFTKRNIGVEMEVTPTVEENENISLKLRPQVTEFEGFIQYGGPSVAIAVAASNSTGIATSGGSSVVAKTPSGFFQPVFTVRSVRTEVTIFDGATVVIGGLTREEVQTIKDKIPLLGDIPLLGRLFRSEGESSQKRNLLIFVTANLVSPGGSLTKQTLRNARANSLFQNPVVVTPGGGVSRVVESGQ